MMSFMIFWNIKGHQSHSVGVIAGPLDRLVVEIYNTTHPSLTFFYDDQIDIIDFEKLDLLYIPYDNPNLLEQLQKHTSSDLIWEQITDNKNSSYTRILIRK